VVPSDKQCVVNDSYLKVVVKRRMCYINDYNDYDQLQQSHSPYINHCREDGAVFVSRGRVG